MKNLTPLPKNLIGHNMALWQTRNHRAQPHRALLKKLITALSHALSF